MINKLDRKSLNNIYLKERYFLSAMIELTTNCNFKCPHCYNDVFKKDNTFEGIKEVIDKLYKMGVVYVALTGGEIFTYKYFEEVYLYLKKRGFLVTLFTNSSNMKKFYDLFRKNKPFKISTTIYGLSEEEYFNFTKTKKNFYTVVESINFMYENNIDFDIKAIVSKENIEAVLEGKYDDFANKYNKKIKYDYSIFSTKSGSEKSKDIRLNSDDIIKFLDKKVPDLTVEMIKTKSPREFQCFGGKTALHVREDLTFSICMKDITRKFDSSLAIYDLKEKLNQRSMEVHKNAEQMKCRNCDMSYGCYWCPIAFNYNKAKGEVDVYQCEIQSKLLDSLYRKEL